MPFARPERYGIARTADVPYLPTGRSEHRLDVYRPAVTYSGPRPVVIYFHGGGFTGLSKDSHRLIALQFAKQGYLVFNVNYRLAPANPFPAAIQDACAAYGWVVRHAARYGGDINKLVLAGESAGANLATSVTLAATYRRPEPWAQDVFALRVVPKVVLPASSHLDVSGVQRTSRDNPHAGALARQRIADVAASYLGPMSATLTGGTDLAEPLRVLERAPAPARPLPAFFSIVGRRDPLLSHTTRLDSALQRLGVVHKTRYYDKQGHAFHAMLWKGAARQAWQDTFAFLARSLGQ